MRAQALLVTALVFATGPAWGEDEFFTPKGGFAVEVSLDNSPEPRLPLYRNAIVSLAVAGDYAIGGTAADAGLSPYLFAVSLSKRQLTAIFPLDRILPDQRAVESGFGRGAQGVLYAGTMPGRPGGSGHVISVRVNGNQLDVSDLGAPVPGEGIFALTSDPSAGVVYGISHPSGKFFVFHPDSRKTELYAETAAGRSSLRSLHDYALEPDDYLCRRLALDRSGRVYGSQPINRIFRFDPAGKKIELLAQELPAVWARRPLGRVDAWALAPDGALYGGNAGDGQLFKIEPATGKVANLGKPAMMPRLKGLAFGHDGRLYGVTGGAPGYSHVFRYDSSDGFVDLGNPRFPMEQGSSESIMWRGFQIGSVAASEDGRSIVLGEEEALSQFMAFPADGQ
jgi:hypothetical protein